MKVEDVEIEIARKELKLASYTSMGRERKSCSLCEDEIIERFFVKISRKFAKLFFLDFFPLLGMNLGKIFARHAFRSQKKVFRIIVFKNSYL